MPSATGYAGSATSDAAIGTVGWTNPGNVTADDGTRATAGGAPFISGAITRYLKTAAHGFAVDPAATIGNIVVELEKSQAAAQQVRDHECKLVKAGVVQPTDKAAVGVDWPVSTDTLFSYTFTAAEHALTPADVNDAAFGVAFAATNASATTTSARVDFIRIIVNYTLAGATFTQQVTVIC